MRVGFKSGSDVLYADAAAVVEEENVDAHEPAAEGPDGVAAGGDGEGFEDGAETEEGAVDEDGGFGGREAFLVAAGERECGVVRCVRGVVEGVGEAVWRR